jgi:hypothetical protein
MAHPRLTILLPLNPFGRPSFPAYTIARNAADESLREFRQRHRAELDGTTVASALQYCESNNADRRRLGVAFLIEKHVLDEQWTAVQDCLKQLLQSDDDLIKTWILTIRFACRSVTQDWSGIVIDCLNSDAVDVTELAIGVIGEFKENAIVRLVERLRQSFMAAFLARRRVGSASNQRPLARALRFAVMQFEHDTFRWLRHFLDQENVTSNPRVMAFFVDPILARRKTTHKTLYRLRWSLTNPDPIRLKSHTNLSGQKRSTDHLQLKLHITLMDNTSLVLN